MKSANYVLLEVILGIAIVGCAVLFAISGKISSNSNNLLLNNTQILEDNLISLQGASIQQLHSISACNLIPLINSLDSNYFKNNFSALNQSIQLCMESMNASLTEYNSSIEKISNSKKLIYNNNLKISLNNFWDDLSFYSAYAFGIFTIILYAFLFKQYFKDRKKYYGF